MGLVPSFLRLSHRLDVLPVARLGDRKSEFSSDEAGEHYAAIQAELEKAFPDYAFPDMISVSVYGLVNSKL